MKAEIKIIRLFRWFNLNTKQSSLVIICWIIILISIVFIIYTDKWQTELKLLYKPSHQKLNELNPCTNSIVSQNQFDIVLSYYSEDTEFVAQYIRYLRSVSTLQKLNPRVIVYNKNPKIDNQVLKIILEADIVQLLPNLGREGGTYFYHIIQNYHIIANHTLFSQAGVEGITNTGLADWYLDRLENQFNLSVGYMPLVRNSMIASYDCGTHRSGNFPRMVQIWSMLEQTLCPPGGQTVTFRGQFLVSGKRIRNRPLQIYKYFYDLLTANSSHWLHRDIRSLYLKSTPHNPVFGHTIERIWTILFKCSKPDLYDRCRNHQCACFDES